jgi:hypothetical protein
MKIMFRFASHLIVVGAFALLIPTLAAASDVERSFKVAMGPMSAPQKNQGNAAGEATTIEPRHSPRHHRLHHKMRRHDLSD